MWGEVYGRTVQQDFMLRIQGIIECGKVAGSGLIIAVIQN